MLELQTSRVLGPHSFEVYGLLSEGELLMEIIVSRKLEVFGAFLRSLNCYRNRCYFQRTNFGKPDDTKRSP